MIYEGRPGLNVTDPVEGPVVTNSRGFFDDEHSVMKPAGTRRIAIFGGLSSKRCGRRYGPTFWQPTRTSAQRSEGKTL